MLPCSCCHASLPADRRSAADRFVRRRASGAPYSTTPLQPYAAQQAAAAAAMAGAGAQGPGPPPGPGPGLGLSPGGAGLSSARPVGVRQNNRWLNKLEQVGHRLLQRAIQL